MRKIKLIICACLLLTIIVPSGLINKVSAQGKEILRYFTSNDGKINNFKVGDIDIEIDEEFTPSEEWDGRKYKKVVKIQNNSSGDAFIRVSINARWVEENGDPWSGDSSYIKLSFSNNEYWKAASDGYHYYSKIISKGEYTEDILKFVEVTVPNELKDRYRGKKIMVDVKSESIQGTEKAYKDAWRSLDESRDKAIIDMLNKLCNK